MNYFQLNQVLIDACLEMGAIHKELEPESNIEKYYSFSDTQKQRMFDVTYLEGPLDWSCSISSVWEDMTGFEPKYIDLGAHLND